MDSKLPDSAKKSKRSKPDIDSLASYRKVKKNSHQQNLSDKLNNLLSKIKEMECKTETDFTCPDVNPIDSIQVSFTLIN